jgi:hypothetical protein
MQVSATRKKGNKALWWGAWTGSFVSFIIGGGVAWIIAGPVLDPVSGLLAGSVAGVMIAAAQWLALQAYPQPAAGSKATRASMTGLATKWAAATAVGLSIGVAAGAALVDYRTGVADLAAMGFVTGTSVGALQAWALKDRVRASWRWLMLSPPLWAASWLITLAIGIDVSLHWAVFGASGALFYTVVTGVALRFLLGAPDTVANSPGDSGR